MVLRRREVPIMRFQWAASPEKRRRRVATKALQQSAPSGALERAAYTIQEFCFRNHISRPAYHRLRLQKRNPAEMRIGLNTVRITAEAERDWQHRMQEPSADFKTRAVERAVKAGDAAARSSDHISKKRRAESGGASDTASSQRGGPLDGDRVRQPPQPFAAGAPSPHSANRPRSSDHRFPLPA